MEAEDDRLALPMLWSERGKVALALRAFADDEIEARKANPRERFYNPQGRKDRSTHVHSQVARALHILPSQAEKILYISRTAVSGDPAAQLTLLARDLLARVDIDGKLSGAYRRFCEGRAGRTPTGNAPASTTDPTARRIIAVVNAVSGAVSGIGDLSDIDDLFSTKELSTLRREIHRSTVALNRLSNHLKEVQK